LWSRTSSGTGATNTCCARRCSRWRARSSRRSLSGAARETGCRPTPSPAPAPHRARAPVRGGAGTVGPVAPVGTRRRPLLARTDRRPRRLRDRLSPTRPHQHQRPRPATAPLSNTVHAPDPARAPGGRGRRDVDVAPQGGAPRLARRSQGRRVAPWPASWRRSANGCGSGRSPSRIGSRGEARREGVGT